MSIRKKLTSLTSLNNPVLVTGHTGFKGTWLGVLLHELGIPYVGLSLPPQDPSLYQELSIGKPLREYFQDVRDYQAVEEIVHQENPSVVIHLAAQPLVIQSFNNPLETFEVNVMGSVNMLEACHRMNTATVLGMVTTDKVYKPQLSPVHSHIEEDEIFGTEPYSASKASVENAIVAWRTLPRQENCTILALRSGNVIGGGDYSDNRLLPDLVRGYLGKGNPEIRFPSATRPWQHVLDPLYGYLLAINKALNDQCHADFNFGPAKPTLTVREVVEIADRTWGGFHRSPLEDKSAIGETKNLALDAGRAERILGWHAFYEQDEAVISTVNWWKQSLNSDLNVVTKDEVQTFIEEQS